MNIMIEKASRDDLGGLEALYNDICDYLSDKDYNPGWKKGCFPTREDALHFLNDNALYVAREDGRIVSSLALTHSPNGESNEETRYDETEYADILYLHIVVVHPDFLRKGIGTRMLAFAEQAARQEGIRALRLYVYEKNYVAVRAYEKSGFRYVEKADIGLKEFGLEWFYLYEKDLRNRGSEAI